MRPTPAAEGVRVRPAPHRAGGRRAAAVALCALLLVVSGAAPASAGHGGHEGEVLPEILLTDLEGISLDLAEYRGKVVHLVFTAVWCEPCQDELPVLRQIALRHGRRGYRLVFVGVSARQDEERLAAWAEHSGFDAHQVCYDRKGEAARSLGVRYLPHHLLVDREGRIDTVGERLPEDLEARLETLLAAETR